MNLIVVSLLQFQRRSLLSSWQVSTLFLNPDVKGARAVMVALLANVTSKTMLSSKRANHPWLLNNQGYLWRRTFRG